MGIPEVEDHFIAAVRSGLCDHIHESISVEVEIGQYTFLLTGELPENIQGPEPLRIGGLAGGG